MATRWNRVRITPVVSSATSSACTATRPAWCCSIEDAWSRWRCPNPSTRRRISWRGYRTKGAADMDEREAALQQIAALARGHGLTAADIAQVIGQSTPAARESQRRSVLVRVLGFLGGTFVFTGIAVF